MAEPTHSVVKSADRVLDLFELLARSGTGISHTDIVEALQIPKSSLTHLLKNLIARGYVSVKANGRGYQLGLSLLTLSRTAGLERDLVSQIEPFLAEITARTGESCALNQLKGQASEVVSTVLGPHRLVTHMRLGDVAPLYATSGGKALLAHFAPADLETYLAEVVLEPLTPQTCQTIDQLRQQLADVRATGFAYSLEEFTPGIVGVASPILDSSDVAIGSINVAVPATRFNPLVKQAAEDALQSALDGLRRQFLRPGRRTGTDLN